MAIWVGWEARWPCDCHQGRGRPGSPRSSHQHSPNGQPGHRHQEDPAAAQGPADLALPPRSGQRDTDLPRKLGLGLGDAERPLPGEAEAGYTATARHLGSDGDDQAYTFQDGLVDGDLRVRHGEHGPGNRQHDFSDQIQRPDLTSLVMLGGNRGGTCRYTSCQLLSAPVAGVVRA